MIQNDDTLVSNPTRVTDIHVINNFYIEIASHLGANKITPDTADCDTNDFVNRSQMSLPSDQPASAKKCFT